jgi:hypothetical protein
MRIAKNVEILQLNTEWAQVEVIDLVNDGSGLGFGIIGGRSTGVVVKTILPGGVADRVSSTKSIYTTTPFTLCGCENMVAVHLKSLPLFVHSDQVRTLSDVVVFLEKVHFQM